MCLCSVVSKELMCHIIQSLPMKTTLTNMVDMLTPRGEELAKEEVAYLAAGDPLAMGEGEGICLFYVNFTLVK